jgi:hypothetical protein
VKNNRKFDEGYQTKEKSSYWSKFR